MNIKVFCRYASISKINPNFHTIKNTLQIFSNFKVLCNFTYIKEFIDFVVKSLKLIIYKHVPTNIQKSDPC